MITRLTIENYKAFQYAELNLTELNLLTGINGVGKSSVIQTLLLLRQSRNMAGLSLKGDLIDIGLGKDALNAQADSDTINLYVEVDNGDTYLDCEFKSEPESDFLPFNRLPTVDIKGNTFTPSMLQWDVVVDGNFQYLNAERKSPSVIFPTSNYQVQQLRSVR